MNTVATVPSRSLRVTLISLVVAFFVACACSVSFIPAQAYAGNEGGALVAAQADSLGKLSASAPSYANVTVIGQANVQSKGWRGAVAQGAKIGTTSKKGLRAFALTLSGLPAGADGHINYITYDKGRGWGVAAADGASSGRESKAVQSTKIWLSGEVANHYDVLYRAYIKGKGWQAWVKNGAKTTKASKNAPYISAIQVKLSPKTEDALGADASALGVRYEARLTKSGWQAWTGDGATAGKKSKCAYLDGFTLMVDAGNLSGGVEYGAYIKGSKWSQGWQPAGAVVGKKNKNIQALRFRLTGQLANAYDIWYRTYVPGKGWQAWVCNGAKSGKTGKNWWVSAVQVKLMTKQSSPAVSAQPTLNGIDIASWQSDINIGKVDADFVIVKATGGKGYTNPYFKVQANSTLMNGKLLGLYHFARERGCSGSAVQEADYFVNAVKDYKGRAVFVLDWEADALLLDTEWAKKFLDRVYAKTGVRPLIYMSKSYTRSYNWSSVAANYKLWVAQYPDYSRTGYQTDPWTDKYGYGAWGGPTIFQYTSTGRISGYGGDLDLDLFYGDKAAWNALAAKS